MDARLVDVLHALEGKRIDLLSVDVFDTLIWRKVPAPTDAFVLLGRRLRDLRMVGRELVPEVFGKLREQAERKARQRRVDKGLTPEVTLEEIYDELPRRLFTRFSREEFMEQELRLEAGITRPNLDLVRVLERAAALGVPVVCVSDTYFSEAHLRALIERPELGEVKIAKLYASSDHRSSKGTGLFRTVLQEWGFAPDRVLHVGDNQAADVEAARAAGLLAVHLPKLSPALNEVLDQELGAIARRAGGYAAVLSGEEGDHGLVWLRSRGWALTAHKRQPKGLRPFWLYGYEVLGPVLALFAEWVCHEAVHTDARVVHGIMREGAFLSELVATAAEHHGIDLDARTIWLSRSVCARATIFEGSAEELRGLITRRKALTVADFCGTVGLQLDALGPFAELGEQRLDAPDMAEKLLAYVTRRADLREAIVLGSRQLRERLLEYLLASAENGRLVLVDLGWNLTIQGGVQRLLEWVGAPVKVEGLYLATTEGARQWLLEGCVARGYLGHGGLPEQFVRRLVRSPEILEQVCSTESGSCVGYDADLRPVLDERRIRPVQHAQGEAVREGVREFQQQRYRYQEAARPELAADPAAVELLRATLERSIVSPTIAEARMFGGWEHDANFGSGDVEPLFTERAGLQVRYGDAAAVARLDMSQIYWPFGAAALFNPPLARALAAVEEGLVPADVLGQPAPTGDVDLFWDTGEGFNERQRQQLPTRVNPSGLLMAQGSCSGEGIVGIRLDPANRPAVIRLDCLWVEVASRDRSGVQELVLRGPDRLAEIIPVNCVPLAPGVVLSRGSDPQLVIRFDPRRFGSVYRVAVSLYFAALPLQSDWSQVDGDPGKEPRPRRRLLGLAPWRKW